MKKIKPISAICEECAKQLYPSHIRKSDKMRGITISNGKCDICGVRRCLIPIRDFHYACGVESAWD